MGEMNVNRRDAEALRHFVRDLLRDVRAMEKMLDEGLFETGIRRIGAEQELFLIDEGYQPAMISLDVLDAIDDPHFTTELGRFNIEYNMDPLEFGGKCLSEMEQQIITFFAQAREGAQKLNADAVMTGILPTLKKSDLSLSNMTPLPRYHALNEALCERRGGNYAIRIKGADEFIFEHDNVMLESCNTSFQVHFQVSPDEFARFYNIAQVAAAPVMALSANSPLLFGKRLWKETRLALFRQSIDTRQNTTRERMARVSFGVDWGRGSVLEIFREDIARFRVLLNTEVDEDPFDAIAEGRAPKLQALSLNNGTVYRWNRPCYGISDNGKPHLRIENRILPAGPTPLDEVANATFWFGLMIAMVEEYKDVTSVIQFDDAKANLLTAARQGLGANLTWVKGRSGPARDLILKRLLPMARTGLRDRGIDEGDIDRYLEVIEARVRSKQTGASWLINSLNNMGNMRTVSERLSTLTAATVARQSTNEPVHKWSLAEPGEGAAWRADFRFVSQIMTTDVFSVNQNELLDLVASVMDWQDVQYVPVEDDDDNFVGLINYRTVLRHILRSTQGGQSISVSDVMETDVHTVTSETLTLDAVRLMKTHHLTCLPIVEDGKLLGLITSDDVVGIARELLEERLTDT